MKMTMHNEHLLKQQRFFANRCEDNFGVYDYFYDKRDPYGTLIHVYATREEAENMANILNEEQERIKDSKNIFDLNYISDLPDDMQHSRNCEKIRELFNLKSELTTMEILVGLYRLHGLKIKSEALGPLLCTLCRKVKSTEAFLTRSSRDTYKKN